MVKNSLLIGLKDYLMPKIYRDRRKTVPNRSEKEYQHKTEDQRLHLAAGGLIPALGGRYRRIPGGCLLARLLDLASHGSQEPCVKKIR